MTLTEKAQELFDGSIREYQRGVYTPEQLVTCLKGIISFDLNLQTGLLMGHGFTPAGAFNHIHGTDSGEEIL